MLTRLACSAFFLLQTKLREKGSVLPLYVTLGLVKHKTRWRSISSEDTNLEHTGHLKPGGKEENTQGRNKFSFLFSAALFVVVSLQCVSSDHLSVCTEVEWMASGEQHYSIIQHSSSLSTTSLHSPMHTHTHSHTNGRQLLTICQPAYQELIDTYSQFGLQ